MDSVSPRSMFVGAVDVHYNQAGGATAALVVCSESAFATVVAEHVADVDHTAPYVPGALFKRELPCIRAVLAQSQHLELLVVDGYATLDPDGHPGLGAHAADAFSVPVIGVAKTRFRTATHAIGVVRGGTSRPLYVTAAGGMDIKEAARMVAAMAGPHRVPSALTRADRLARGRALPGAADDGKITLNVNGAAQSVNVPATGGFKKWQVIELKSIRLKAGVNKLRIYADMGGFNLHWMKFDKEK